MDFHELNIRDTAYLSGIVSNASVTCSGSNVNNTRDLFNFMHFKAVSFYSLI